MGSGIEFPGSEFFKSLAFTYCQSLIGSEIAFGPFENFSGCTTGLFHVLNCVVNEEVLRFLSE